MTTSQPSFLKFFRLYFSAFKSCMVWSYLFLDLTLHTFPTSSSYCPYSNCIELFCRILYSLESLLPKEFSCSLFSISNILSYSTLSYEFIFILLIVQASLGNLWPCSQGQVQLFIPPIIFLQSIYYNYNLTFICMMTWLICLFYYNANSMRAGPVLCLAYHHILRAWLDSF